MKIAQPLHVRFVRFVKRSSACWLWIGGTTKDGYGKFNVPFTLSQDGKKHTARAHRVAWYLEYGHWPKADESVLHTCDQPLCVRPSHLFLGTQADNVQDMIMKGRSAVSRGTARGGPNRPEHARLARLDMAKAEQIRELVTDGNLSLVEIAHIFGVSDCTIRDIVKKRTWIKERWD